MLDSGNWWYDKTTESGIPTSTSDNNDMFSPAFYTVNASEIKVTRNDQDNTSLLETSGNCLGNTNFRAKLTSYGNFRSSVWASDSVQGSCSISYGGVYQSTEGFEQSNCNGNIASSNTLSFWSDWSQGDGAVMMIGGGGDSCSRADHGIGITEANDASFYGISSTNESDFGYNSGSGTSAYSLNLWVR